MILEVDIASQIESLLSKIRVDPESINFHFDSLQLVTLIDLLEEQFQIQLQTSDISKENFESKDSLIRLVVSKKA